MNQWSVRYVRAAKNIQLIWKGYPREFQVKRAGSCSKLCSKGLQNLYSSPDITAVMKSTQDEMGGTHRTQGCNEKIIQFWLDNLEGRDGLGDPGVGGRIILKYMLKDRM